MVKTYDCTDGGYRYEWCRGCYTMTEDKDGQGYWVQKSDYDALTAERDQWKAGSAHVNGALLKRIAELEAALRLVREWADGACPYFDKGREADILGSEAETVDRPSVTDMAGSNRGPKSVE